MLPVSSLSQVCNQIADFVRVELDAASNNITVSIGSPAEVDDSTSEHRLNLFFYRLEPSAFQAGARPDEPWRLRLFCLITPFGIAEDENGTTIGAGENELRILGEVLRVFHERPIQDALAVNGITIRMQAVFMPITDEQINQIWSTQGDTAYRPSIAYELSLVPIVPNQLRSPPLLVGAIGAQARAGNGRHASFVGTVTAPPVKAATVTVEDPAWIPLICWIEAGSCHRSLAHDLNDLDLSTYTPVVWLAGDPSASVELVWEVWQSDGWAVAGAPISAQPYGTAIDPEAIPDDPGNFPLAVPLPSSVIAADGGPQLLLYAQRQVAGRQLRSDPLLLTLYRS